MTDEKEHWVKPLDNESIILIKESLKDIDHLWGKHDRFGGNPLSQNNYGDTIWLHLRRFSSQWITYKNTNLDRLQSFIDSLVAEDEPQYGRAYIHRLAPGKQVFLHSDADSTGYFESIKRYQLYKDIPPGIEIVSEPIIKSNSFVLFRHDIPHAYYNKSDETLIFIVFDVLQGKHNGKI
jgi:hypothetical protein